jgi:hypothetical protein
MNRINLMTIFRREINKKMKKVEEGEAFEKGVKNQ